MGCRVALRTNKIIVRALVALGFGGAVGLASGCSASRAARSRQAEGYSVSDSVVVRDVDGTVRVMYGTPPARFDPNRPVPEFAPLEQADETAK